MYLATTPGFTRFTYHFLGEDGAVVGDLRWPDVAVATNARLKRVYPKTLNRKFRMNVGEACYEIEFEYLSRAMENDVRFHLLQGETVIASADVLRPKTFWGRQPTIRINHPFVAELVNCGSWRSLRYELRGESKTYGAVFEAAKLSMKRRITIDLPEGIPLPEQFFVFFLVVNAAY